jgi:hypothetical protein
MKDEARLIEASAELLAEVHEMRQDLNALFGETNQQLTCENGRLEKLEKQQMKTNLTLGELRLLVIRLGDREHIVDDLVARVKRLKKKFFIELDTNQVPGGDGHRGNLHGDVEKIPFCISEMKTCLKNFFAESDSIGLLSSFYLRKNLFCYGQQ